LDDDLFHTYSTYARGTESLNDAYSHLDATPYGRQEDLKTRGKGWSFRLLRGGKGWSFRLLRGGEGWSLRLRRGSKGWSLRLLRGGKGWSLRLRRCAARMAPESMAGKRSSHTGSEGVVSCPGERPKQTAFSGAPLISARSNSYRYYRRNCYTTPRALFRQSTFALRCLRSCKSPLREEKKGR
jgi:hypothetical protein